MRESTLVRGSFFNSSNTLTAHYKYGYDSNGNIVRSIDILLLKEYNYLYEGGQLVRAVEYDITLDTNQIVTAKTVSNSIKYYYDDEGTLIKKRISCGENEQIIYYEKGENDSTVAKFTVGGKNVTSHSKTDSFGRKIFDEIQFGSGFASRRFDYLTGEYTDVHTANNKLKSTPTTQLVSRITFSNGRTIDYEYDKEERITKVTDSVGGTTEYTYDALGQLTSENNMPVGATVYNVIGFLEYDNYGNITRKNSVPYTYDSVWKDKLIAVGDKTITYDAQGNPTSYLGHNLTWEKGRQLKSFDSNNYTYNANGIRTSKYVSSDDSYHTYVLDGTKILREDWTAYGGALNYSIVPIYDNEDNVAGISFCGMVYYFNKNLQGDVIEIVSGYNGETVARYTYDAWGKCTIDSASSDYVIAVRNPFRYRSYYYDSETDLYYLQSRYYDPNVGRFVNGDSAEMMLLSNELISNNLFTYCCNNIINYIDILGYKSFVVHIARVISSIAGLAGTFVAIGKAVPILKRVIVTSLVWTIKITGAAGRLAACLTAILALIVILLAIKSLYDMLRVFFGTIKYVVQEIRYGLNPWHKHKKGDLTGPDFKNPFKGW